MKDYQDCKNEAIDEIDAQEQITEYEKSKKKKRMFIVLGGVVLAIIIGILISYIGLKKNQYYIDLPKDTQIKDETICMTLGDDTVEDIEEYIVKVVEWYNEVDISQPLPLDFVDDELNDMGKALIHDSRVEEYKQSYGTVNADIFKNIYPASSICGEIARIMVTSELSIGLINSEEATISITEEDWIALGDVIKEAIDFYY